MADNILRERALHLFIEEAALKRRELPLYECSSFEALHAAANSLEVLPSFICPLIEEVKALLE